MRNRRAFLTVKRRPDTRPDTRRSQSRAGWQGPYLKSLEHLSKNSEANDLNSRKSVRWSAVPVPCLIRLGLKLEGNQGSGPERVDDLCFHTYGEFSPSPPSSPPSPPLPLKSQS